MKLLLSIVLTCILKYSLCQDASINDKILKDIKAAVSKHYYYPSDTLRIFSILDSFKNYNSTEDDFLWDLTTKFRTELHQKHFNFYTRYDTTTTIKKRNFIRKQIDNITRKIERHHLIKEIHTDAYDYGPIILLSKNIGYIKINSFDNRTSNPNRKTPRFKTVIKKFKRCNSIIIDLRDNRGGFIQEAINLTSYLAPHDSIYLISIYHSEPILEGKKQYSHEDYYTKNLKHELNLQRIIVLTSKNTFSAGETAVYSLQKLKNVIVMGDTTAASGLGDNIEVGNKYAMFEIPTCKMIDTVNKYSFEEHGVIPNIIDTGNQILSHAINLVTEDNSSLTPGAIEKLNSYEKEYEQTFDYGRIKILKHQDKSFIQYDGWLIEQIMEEKSQYKSRHFTAITFLTSDSSSQIKVTWKNGKQEIYTRR